MEIITRGEENEKVIRRKETKLKGKEDKNDLKTTMEINGTWKGENEGEILLKWTDRVQQIYVDYK